MRCKVTLASGIEGTLTLRCPQGAGPVAATATRKSAAKPEQVAEIVRAILGERLTRVEVVVVITLDARSKVIAAHEVSVGSLMSSVLHPREVFRAAVLDSAAALIVAHNHPSGDPTPSVEDHQVTARLVEAGSVMGIRLLDHVVVADSDFRSFAREGWI